MNHEEYAKTRAQGLCVYCKEPAVPGKSMCKMCAKITNEKQKEYARSLPEDKKKKRNEYIKQWRSQNPEKVRAYKRKCYENKRQANNIACEDKPEV